MDLSENISTIVFRTWSSKSWQAKWSKRFSQFDSIRHLYFYIKNSRINRHNDFSVCWILLSSAQFQSLYWSRGQSTITSQQKWLLRDQLHSHSISIMLSYFRDSYRQQVLVGHCYGLLCIFCVKQRIWKRDRPSRPSFKNKTGISSNFLIITSGQKWHQKDQGRLSVCDDTPNGSLVLQSINQQHLRLLCIRSLKNPKIIYSHRFFSTLWGVMWTRKSIGA